MSSSILDNLDFEPSCIIGFDRNGHKAATAFRQTRGNLEMYRCDRPSGATIRRKGCDAVIVWMRKHGAIRFNCDGRMFS